MNIRRYMYWEYNLIKDHFRASYLRVFKKISSGEFNGNCGQVFVRVLVWPDMVSRVIQFERLRHMCEGNVFFRLIIHADLTDSLLNTIIRADFSGA